MPKGRILAVDDQRYFRELIESLLAEEGFEAQTASSGEEALRVLDHARFDIVVTDLVMPGMDGSELVHRIKERDPDQDVVVVTGVVDVKTAVDAMKVGATDYLLKPFDRKTLAVLLEGILQRRRLSAEHDRLLAENIEYLGERSLFERAIALFSCIVLEPLAEKIVEGLCVETHAQGGVLWIGPEGGDEPLTLAAASGLVRLDTEPHEISLEAVPPEIANGSARSMLADWRDAEGRTSRALYLPVRREGRVTGVARLTDKIGGEPFDGVDRACAEKFLAFAEGALANALRFRELERGSLGDPSTGAYTFEYFQDMVRNEVEKASRFGRSFSLLAIEIGSLDGLRQQRGAAGLGAWREGVVERLRPLLRATDLVAAEGEGRLFAILPEADALGAAALKRRAWEELAASELIGGLDDEVRPELRIGAATYPGDGTQLESLLRSLDSRLEEERCSPVRLLGLEQMSFAESLQALLAQGHTDRPETAEQIVRFVLGEVCRRPRARGLCFVAPGDALEQAVMEGLGSLDGNVLATEIVVIGGGERRPPLANSAVTWISPQRAPGLPPFLIHCGGGPAFAMVRSEKTTDYGVPFFHTDDRSLVEHLAFRLQGELELPPSEILGERS
jgi:diguanylate cyclase (GGDEF)-like protein